MKILIPEALPTAGVARPGAIYEQQWRKALEEAQWQARQRIAPERDSGRAAPDMADTAGDAGVAPMSSRAQTRSMLSFAASAPQSPNSGRLQQLSSAVSRVVLDAAAAAQSSAVSPDGVGVPAGPTANAGAPITAAAAAEAPAATLLLRWQQLPDWPAVVVHASVTGNRISVGMRDRSVAEHEVPELFQRLRAQLRSSGLELTHLVINGQQVSADDIVSGIA